MQARYIAFDRTMPEWRDSLIGWGGPSAADPRKYGAPYGC
jgi:hypothetical protein